MKKSLIFATLALTTFAMVGCSDPSGAANDWIGALLDNDKDDIEQLTCEEYISRYKDTAEDISKGEDKKLQYILENLEITRVVAGDAYARAYFALKVPVEMKLENPYEDVWVGSDMRPVSDGTFKNAVAKAYLENDSDADIYGDDALDFIEDAINDTDELEDFIFEMAEVEAENAKQEFNLSDQEREMLEDTAIEGSIELARGFIGILTNFKFESYEDFFDSLEVVHEEKVGDGRICYLTLDAPEAGYIEVIKDAKGEWRVNRLKLNID